jgi:hypothetical protein
LAALEDPTAALLYIDAAAFLRTPEKIPHQSDALSLRFQLQDLLAAELLHAQR